MSLVTLLLVALVGAAEVAWTDTAVRTVEVVSGDTPQAHDASDAEEATLARDRQRVGVLVTESGRADLEARAQVPSAPPTRPPRA